MPGGQVRESLARVHRDADARTLQRGRHGLAVVAVGRDDEHLVGRQAEAQEPAHLGGDRHGLAIRAGGLDEAHGAVAGGGGSLRGENAPRASATTLGRRAVGRRAQLLDSLGAPGQPLEAHIERAKQRPRRLVREREQQAAASRQRRQQAQLRG